MRPLAIVHTESSCGWGGQELRIITESRGLLDRGHEVCIAAPAESRLFTEARRRGIPSCSIDIARKNLRGFRAMRRFLAGRKIDVVNSHSSTDSWLAALALKSLPRAERRPLVRTRHISAAIPRSPATRWLYRSATAHVVTTGEILRQQVVSSTGLEASRVTSVPTGVDLERYSPGDRVGARAELGLPQDAFIVGIVATLRSWKGHRYLVDAVAAIDDPRCLLAMVGGGPGMPYLRDQIDKLRVENRILMPGNQDDVVPWLRAFDVFALPSYANEGVPQAIMQAMACRLPVVTTPIGAIPEIVQDGVTGVFVQPQDAYSLRAALVRLHDDGALRERLAANGHHQAQEKFSAATMAASMEKIFSDVVAARA
jgi:glycosyltransferase involved in cell wall biosynthesis